MAASESIDRSSSGWVQQPRGSAIRYDKLTVVHRNAFGVPFFEGTAWITTEKSASGVYSVNVTSYRIEKKNGAVGGNHANLMLESKFALANGGQAIRTAHSGDDLSQDGGQHDYNISNSYASNSNGQREINVGIEFTFDKSAAADPTESTSIDFTL